MVILVELQLTQDMYGLAVAKAEETHAENVEIEHDLLT